MSLNQMLVSVAALFLLGCGGGDTTDVVGRPDASGLNQYDGSPIEHDGSPALDSNMTTDNFRVFVTSEAYTGDFNHGSLTGIEAMDAVCQVHADAAVLGGSWKAWVSTELVDAIDRIVGQGPWVRMDGELLFLNRASLALTPEFPISLDENSVSRAGEQAWTGTILGGVYGGNDCQGFTTASDQIRGIIGGTSYVDSNWTDDRTQSGFDKCIFMARLYCFEQ